MNRKIVSPFDGEPKTVQVTDEHGNTSFRVIPRVLTPERVKWAEFLAGLCTLTLMGVGFYGLTEVPEAPSWQWFAVLFAPVIVFPVLNSFWQSLFYTGTEIVMTRDEFRVRRWNGWNRYDRTLKHQFTLIPHDKAQKEKDQNEFMARRAQADGRVIAPKRYYGDSFHVVFKYLSQRNDVVTVYGRNEAIDILTRLVDCDERLNQLNGMGDGVSLNPDDEWTPGPGDIP